jgi:hypothetical protein
MRVSEPIKAPDTAFLAHQTALDDRVGKEHQHA